MKQTLLLSVHFVLHGALGSQFHSFIGCFKDDSQRDLKKSKGRVKNIKTCRAWAQKKDYKFFSLQWGGECFGDNSFGDPHKKYPQLNPQKCVRKGFFCGNSEHILYCGGGWANAVYSTAPVKIKVPKRFQFFEIWGPPGTNARCPGAEGYNIYMQECGGNKKRLWSWTKKGQLRLLKWMGWMNLCLDPGNGRGRGMYLKRCHNGNNQKWYWANGANLKNRGGGKCLTYNGDNGGLVLKRCNQGVIQNWWYDLAQPIYQVHKVWYGYWAKRKMYMIAYGGGRRFALHQGLQNGNYYGKFVLKKFGDWYHIKMESAMVKPDRRKQIRPDNGYLSSNAAGTNVDLWNQDDGSGRQRWKIKLRKGGFNIMVAGGVRGGRKYLSSKTGKTYDFIFLSPKDDGSGKQRWQLHGSLVPTPKPTPKPTPRPTPVPVKNLKSGGGWKIVKGHPHCTISIENGVNFPCVVSPNYPKVYSREMVCEISMKKTSFVQLHGSTEKWFDYLTLSGKQYSGKLANKKVALKGNVKWTADFYEETKGWRVCKVKKPNMKVG